MYWGPGGGGGGPPPPDDLSRQTARALNLLVDMKTCEEEHRRKKELTDTDVRLKVEQKLVKISATSAEKFPDEIDQFEVQMRRNRVKTWQMWYYYFEQSLEQKAREWIDGTHTREPGLSRYEYAQSPDAPDHAWAEVYR